MGKISALPSDSSPTSDDYTVTVDTTSGQTKKVLLSDLLAYVNANGVPTYGSYDTFYNPCKFSVYRNAAQNDGGATPAIVQFDTTVFDTGSDVDIVTNKGRFTAPVAGYYQFNAGVWRNGKSGGTIYLYKNGSLVHSGGFSDGSGVNELHVLHPPPLLLAADDYIDVRAGGEGSVRSLTVGASTCYFGGFLVSAT